MEEILASIRRIIADDQSLPVRGEPDPAPAARDTRRPIPPSAPIDTGAGAAEAERRYDRPPIERLRPAVAPVAPAAEQQAAPDMAPAVGPAYGAVAAPQFASPAGPVINADAPPAPSYAPQDPASAPAAPQESPLRVSRGLEPSEPAPRDAVIASIPSPAAPGPVRDAPAQPDRSVAPVDAGHAPADLLSAATDSAVSAAFNMLAASRLADNSDELMTLAREMIRPLLRNWIDDHLPSMVERMVRAEIERVARGGR